MVTAGLSQVQSCPDDCQCGTTFVSCTTSDRTSFPQLPVDAQQSVQTMYEVSSSYNYAVALQLPVYMVLFLPYYAVG